MAGDDTTERPDDVAPPEPTKKVSVRTLILLASEAFPFDTNRLGTVQGRSLSGPMETALVHRLPAGGSLSDLEVSRIFMGCASGIAEEKGKPVFNPLTSEQAAELTDADVGGFAKAYLTRVAKAPLVSNPIEQLAAYARQQRDRVAEDLDKHGSAVRESMRSISANNSIMQNWKQLQDVIQGPALDLQREFKRAMGPADRATDAIRDAIASIRGPSFATDAIREAVEAAEARNAAMKAALGGTLRETMEEFRRQIAAPHETALDELRRQMNLTGITAAEDLRRQLDGATGSALDEIRRQTEQLSGFGSDIVQRASETPGYGLDPASGGLRLPHAFEMPRMPPMSETPLGRTAAAVEELREAGGRMEASMDIIVSQAGEVSKLIGEVSGTIQVEARQFQTQSAVQTKKAIRYARWSLGISAVAIVITAWFSVLGYRADRADARSQEADAKTVAQLLREQNGQLRAALERREPAKAASEVPKPKVAPASPAPLAKPLPSK